MKKLRFGIIGCGIQGQFYKSIIQGDAVEKYGLTETMDNAEVTAISSGNEALRKELESTTNIRCFSNWKDMIDSDACDAVIITVPHPHHHDPAIYALNAGKHVLCEKPMCVRASDARKIYEAAQAHPEAVLGMVFNQRTNPMYQKIKELVSSGELGEIRRSNWIINDWWRGDIYYNSNPWRATWKEEGGGVLVNQTPHQLDLWIWICGTPTKVYAKNIVGAHRNIPVENDVTVVTEYANGATGCFIACTHDPCGTNRLEIDLSKGKIVLEDGKKLKVYRFHESEEEINAKWDHYSFQDTKAAKPETFFTVEEFEGGMSYGNDHTCLIRNYADHILNGTPLIADGLSGLLETQIANCAQLSGWLHEEVAFPCDEAAYNKILQELIDEEGM